MKKSAIIAVMALFALIALTGCLKKGPASTNAPDSGNNQPASGQPEQNAEKKEKNDIVSSIKELMDRGDALQCTWRDNEEKSEINGELFISGKKMKNTVTFKNLEKNGNDDAQMPDEFQSFMVSDGNWFYVWGTMPGMQKGTKYDISKLEQPDQEGSQGLNKQDLEKKMNYSCKPWSVDDSYFTLPAGVEFTDETQEIQDLQKSVQNIDTQKLKESTCALCDKAPTAEARESCRKGAKCD